MSAKSVRRTHKPKRTTAAAYHKPLAEGPSPIPPIRKKLKGANTKNKAKHQHQCRWCDAAAITNCKVCTCLLCNECVRVYSRPQPLWATSATKKVCPACNHAAEEAQKAFERSMASDYYSETDSEEENERQALRAHYIRREEKERKLEEDLDLRNQLEEEENDSPTYEEMYGGPSPTAQHFDMSESEAEAEEAAKEAAKEERKNHKEARNSNEEVLCRG